MRLRFYHIYDGDGNWCAGVVAETAGEAKKMIFGDERVDSLDWIEISVRWAKGADVTGFEKGVFEECLEAHKRGIYNSYGETDGCEYCKARDECKKLKVV